MQKEVEPWAGQFGDEYTARNLSDPPDRYGLWRGIVGPDCRSILEVGANVGHNLEAISRINPALALYATEPNHWARIELAGRRIPNLYEIKKCYANKIDFSDGAFDLVITCGVLIHVPPDQLADSLKEIYRVASRYIVCMEYFAPSEEMIPYRGKKDMLWRRDYGSLFMDAFPDLYCECAGFLWKRVTGMDNLVVWKLFKGPMRH